MKKLFKYIWQIPRRPNEKDRCAECFRMFKQGQFKFKSKKHAGERYSHVCIQHKDEELKIES